MPANKNAVTRYKILDGLLSDRRHYYDIHDLTERVNAALESDGQSSVCERSIQKDLNYLEFFPFNAELDRFSVSGKSCIRYKDPAFSIFTKKLSEEEENLLAEVLNTLGQFEGLNNFEWLNQFKARLNLKERDKIIYFDYNPYLKNSNLLGELFTAISSKQVIDVEYQRFYSDESRHHLMHPYFLKEYNNRWFVIGALEDGFIVNFALDRIVNFTPRPEKQYVECPEDIQERYEDIVGVTYNADQPVEHILFWVSKARFPYIETKPLHPSQALIRGDEDKELREKYSYLGEGYFYSLDVIQNYELTALFVSHLPDIIVLTPANLADKIAQIIDESTNKFSRRK